MSVFSKTAFAAAIAAMASTVAIADEGQHALKFAGALEFSPEGTLFVGDNYNGAIFSFDFSGQPSPEQVEQISVSDIDVKIADLLGTGLSAIEINDMAVHPVSHDVYISVSRIGNHVSKPVIMKVAQGNEIEIVDLSQVSSSMQPLAHYPDQDTTFKTRGLMGMPPTPRDVAKGDVKLNSLAIMVLHYHDGELFASGVAYDDFLSTLRRIPVPFDGAQSATSVEIYHISHDQYETRAPIRAMSVQTIDGKDQLVAAYTCSPVALIPLDSIKDGEHISANVIGNIGNGQPIDMIEYSVGDQELLFLSNNSRSPQVIPIAGLSDAKVVSDKDFERGPKMDLDSIMPFGPVGKTVMFEGSSLHIDKLSDRFFVSITRDARTGSLNLDSNLSMFPNRLHNLVAEYDFPQYYAETSN